MKNSSILSESSELTRQRWNVLVVDDDQEVLDAHAMYFDCMGHHVIKQLYPLKACEYLQHGDLPINLLVTDFMMPDMNGLELVQEARNSGYAGPTLMVSAYLGGFDSGMVNRLGVDTMAKPVRYYELVAYVEGLQGTDSAS